MILHKGALWSHGASVLQPNKAAYDYKYFSTSRQEYPNDSPWAVLKVKKVRNNYIFLKYWLLFPKTFNLKLSGSYFPLL